MVATADKPSMGKGLRIASGCSTLDEFTAVFRKFCTPDSIFFATKLPRALGEDIKFAVSLKDGKIVMRGTGRVVGSFVNADNQYKRPGMTIEFKVLDTMGKILLKELNAGVSSVKPLKKDQGFEVPTAVHENGEETKVAPDRSAAVDHSDDGEEVTSVSPDSMDDQGFDPSEMEEYVECTVVEEEAQESADDDIDEEDEDDDDDERTMIGPAPTDPGLEATQVAPEMPRQKPKTSLPKLPGMPAAVRGDPTQQGLGPGGEDATVLAASPSATGGPSPKGPRTPPSSQGAVPTPVPPSGPRIEGVLPAPGSPVLPQMAPGGMSTQMGMPPLMPPGMGGPNTPPPGMGGPNIPPPGMGGPNTPPPGMGGPNTPPPGMGGPNIPPPGAGLGVPFPAAPPALEGLSGPPGTPPPGDADAKFRVPSPPQGFRVPTPAELASAIMEPLDGQSPEMGPPAGMLPAGATPEQPGPTGEAEFGHAPGRVQSTGPHTAGQSFPDFVAPTGPMPMPQAGSAAKAPGGISNKIIGVIALACLIVGVGIGFVVGQATASSTSEAKSAGATESGVPAAGSEVEPVNAALALDAGTAALAKNASDASVALATTEDASVETDAGAPDASADTTIPATATTPEIPDPGEPKEGECALVLKITPADATVTVNSVKIEKGATKVNIPCGVFPTMITHPDYKNHKDRIVLKPNRVNTMEYALRRPNIVLKITSVPSRALVTLGGEDLGRTPISRAVPGGQAVELKLIRSGYKPHSQTITPTGPTKLNIRLKRRRRGKRSKKKKTKITL